MTSRDNLLMQLYATVKAPELWPEVLEELKDFLQSGQVFLATRSTVDEQPLGFLEAGFDPGHFERYQKHFFNVDVWTKGLADKQSGRFWTSEQACADKTFLRSEIYNDFARPAGIRHSIGCLLPNEYDTLVTEVAFMRDAARGAYDAIMVRAANDLLPHVQQVVSLSHQFKSLQGRLKNLETFLLSMAYPAAVFNSSMKIDVVNDAFITLADKEDSFRINQGKSLSINHSALSAVIERAITQVCHNGCFTSLRKIIQFTTGQYLVELRPWLSDIMTVSGIQQNIAFCLTLKPAKAGHEVTAYEIREVTQLTQAEAEICAALCNGDSPEIIAIKRGSKVISVRQQLKVVMAKMGVNSQVQLVGMILRFVL